MSENYPSECIAAKALIDPHQRRYQIKGMEKAVPKQQMKAPSEPSDTSLQLKPAKGKDKRDITYEARTPSKTDEESIRAPWTESQVSSDQQSASAAQRNEGQNKIEQQGVGKPNEASDALAAAIEEAKAAPEKVVHSFLIVASYLLFY